MPSSTVENYLKCIYMEEQRLGDQRVTTGQIATALQVTPGTATSMVKALSDAGLVSYEPYNGVKLTPEGFRLAAHVLRRHRIVELFLVKVMGMDWAEVHNDAEVLEHAVSDRLIERMFEMLGRPSVDPHGDPIPTAGGVVDEKEYANLVDCPLWRPLRLARVIDQGVDFLRLLKHHGLVPGSELRVESRQEEADTILVRAASGKPVSLGLRAASKILVEPIG